MESSSSGRRTSPALPWKLGLWVREGGRHLFRCTICAVPRYANSIRFQFEMHQFPTEEHKTGSRRSHRASTNRISTLHADVAERVSPSLALRRRAGRQPSRRPARSSCGSLAAGAFRRRLSVFQYFQVVKSLTPQISCRVAAAAHHLVRGFDSTRRAVLRMLPTWAHTSSPTVSASSIGPIGMPNTRAASSIFSLASPRSNALQRRHHVGRRARG